MKSDSQNIEIGGGAEPKSSWLRSSYLSVIYLKESFSRAPTSAAAFLDLPKMFMLLSVGLNPGCELGTPKRVS